MEPDLLLRLGIYSLAALLTLSAIAMAFLTTYAQIETGRLPRRCQRCRRLAAKKPG